MVISILLLRPREGKSFSQSRTASKWQSQDLNPRLSDNKTILTILCSLHVVPDFRSVDEHNECYQAPIVMSRYYSMYFTHINSLIFTTTL